MRTGVIIFWLAEDRRDGRFSCGISETSDLETLAIQMPRKVTYTKELKSHDLKHIACPSYTNVKCCSFFTRALRFFMCSSTRHISRLQRQPITVQLLKSISCQTAANFLSTFANRAPCLFLSGKVYSDQQASVICLCRWGCFQVFSE